MSSKNMLTRGLARKEFRSIVGEASDLSLEVFNELIKNKGIFTCMRKIYKYDIGTYKHSIRTFNYAMMMADILLPRREDILVLGAAALVHDVGKTKIPIEILLKPARFTLEERAIMEQHVLEGALILQKVGVRKEVLKIALQHHERSDGSGYPAGMFLRETEIMSHYLAIADVFDAITFKRSYNEAVTTTAALQIILDTVGLDDLSSCGLALALGE